MAPDGYWDERAESYERDTAYVVGADLLEVMREAVLGAGPSGDLVELGCGTGTFTRDCAPLCRSVIATDIAPHMVEIAGDALREFANVSALVADASSTGLPSESADTVLVINLIHIVPEPAAVLAEAHRLLRRGGTLIVSSYSAEGLSLPLLIAFGLRGLRRFGIGLQRRRTDFTQAKLEETVRQAGFDVIDGRVLRGRKASAVFAKAERRI